MFSYIANLKSHIAPTKKESIGVQVVVPPEAGSPRLSKRINHGSLFLL